MDKNDSRRMFYFLIGCLVLSIIIIGATYAYFLANTSDDKTVYGETNTLSFSLRVSRVTSADMAFGLIPMRNEESPNAASQLCLDDNGNAGCQIYKIVVSNDYENDMFLDGYIVMDTKDGVETRFTRVYPEKVEDVDDSGNVITKTIYRTNYTKEDFNDSNFDMRENIKTGMRTDNTNDVLNHTTDYDCLFVKDEILKSKTEAAPLEFYVMIWVYDNGELQNDIQGLEQAFTGSVIFNSAEGNQIKATFN